MQNDYEYSIFEPGLLIGNLHEEVPFDDDIYWALVTLFLLLWSKIFGVKLFET